MTKSESIVERVSSDNLMSHVRTIAQWVRVSGSAEEATAFDYLQQQLTSFGYAVTRYESDALIGLPGEARLTLGDGTGTQEDIPANGYAFGAATGDEGLLGDVVYVGAGTADDYARTNAAGKIVLCDGIAMPDKVRTAQLAGAVGQIHINDDHFHEMCISPVWGTPVPETISLLPSIPTLSVKREDGDLLKAALARGPMRVRMVTKPTLAPGELPTLIGDLPAAGDETFVLFSGHVDSWHHGAMDNGTANATQLEVARLLAERRDALSRGVRIAFWSGHSQSRYGGSAWYADTFWHELHERCVCHVNIDSVGAIGADVLTGAATMAETFAFGSGVIADVTGQELAYNRMSRSSDQSFWGHGIPSLFAALSQQGGPDGENGFGLGWWWHTTEDTLDKVDPGNLRRDASVFALALWRLCTDERLSFDYAAVANEIDDALAGYEARAGGAFDLGGTRALAQKLKASLGELALENLDAGESNALVMDLGRLLIPVNYTTSGPFDQDLAVSTSALPSLRCIDGLQVVNGRDAMFLCTKLVRERNRIEHALREAIRRVQRASDMAKSR